MSPRNVQTINTRTRLVTPSREESSQTDTSAPQFCASAEKSSGLVYKLNYQAVGNIPSGLSTSESTSDEAGLTRAFDAQNHDTNLITPTSSGQGSGRESHKGIFSPENSFIKGWIDSRQQDFQHSIRPGP
jgi:hypothetical protein